jgi:hypothetical protein
MTINRLYGMMFRHISKAEMEWLKNRCNDDRPEVQTVARQVFEEKFPRQARNEIKARLHIKNITLHIRNEIYDDYGDEHFANAEFTADTSGRIVRKLFGESDALVEETSVKIGVKAIRKLFNVAVHNYDIPFWDTDLCHEVSYDPDIDLLPEYRYDDEFYDGELDDDGFDGDGSLGQPESDGGDAPDDRAPAWSVRIEYKNGTEQNTKGCDFLPNPVMELFGDLNGYFEEDELDNEFDDEFGNDE